MKITQEQLDKYGECVELQSYGTGVSAAHRAWDQLGDHAKNAYRDVAKSVLEAHYGEPIEIAEPEPEIPYGVIDAAASDMHRHLTPNELNHPCKCRVRVKAVLLAAYKAGWGGMRK